MCLDAIVNGGDFYLREACQIINRLTYITEREAVESDLQAAEDAVAQCQETSDVRLGASVVAMLLFAAPLAAAAIGTPGAMWEVDCRLELLRRDVLFEGLVEMPYRDDRYYTRDPIGPID